jgi:hypothetical protein
VLRRLARRTGGEKEAGEQAHEKEAGGVEE